MNERDKELARRAGMVYREFEDEFANANTDGVDQKTMQNYAELIRADEREACANLVFYSPPSDEYESQLVAVYNAIRARGTNDQPTQD
jgi:hypothetical protein